MVLDLNVFASPDLNPANRYTALTRTNLRLHIFFTVDPLRASCGGTSLMMIKLHGSVNTKAWTNTLAMVVSKAMKVAVEWVAKQWALPMLLAMR